MIIRPLIALSAALMVAGCGADGSAPGDTLEAAARDYVQLSLTIGEKEEGYIDAYYGPPELQAAARAEAPKLSLPELVKRTDALAARVSSIGRVSENFDARRAAFLTAQLLAAKTRLRMLSGEKLSFEDEALGLFGVRPVLQPLASYDRVLARIETLVPGSGPLSERVDAFQDRFLIPTAKLKAVFDAAITECKARTLRHVALPPAEKFNMAFVTGKSWSAYNYYLGKATSRIEINTDLPIRIDRPVQLGCHEGYPGHHVLNALLEQRLVQGKGWLEYSVYPLYSPQSLIAEGSANYGVDLAFPGPERLAYETSALYPLAGLPVADAARYASLQDAMKALAGARISIAREYLEGRISEAEAVKLAQRYQLISEARAKQSIGFTKQYRSYVINYGLGQDMIRADVEAAGTTPNARWKRMEQLISEPTLPSDLRGGT